MECAAELIGQWFSGVLRLLNAVKCPGDHVFLDLVAVDLWAMASTTRRLRVGMICAITAPRLDYARDRMRRRRWRRC